MPYTPEAPVDIRMSPFDRKATPSPQCSSGIPTFFGSHVMPLSIDLHTPPILIVAYRKPLGLTTILLTNCPVRGVTVSQVTPASVEDRTRSCEHTANSFFCFDSTRSRIPFTDVET